MDVVAASLATLIVGLAVGWLGARSRSAGELSVIRRERDAASSERDTARAERDSARAEREGLRAEREVIAQRARAAEIELAASGARLTALTEADQQLKDTFARMSTEALQANRQQFLDLADDRFKQAGRPLTETLGKVEAQLRDIEQKREGAQATLAEQISFVRMTGEQLRSETAALVSALRKPQTRGQWGELTLRRCLDHAGMLDRSDFVEQASMSTADGTLRPDLVIKLVGGKNIVVDAKVTLSAFLEAHEATDDVVREERLTAHARHLRKHVDSLADKAYWEHLSPAPEFVVLFVPGDAFLAAALDRDSTLLEDAFRKRVHITTPTTLISVLRTVAYAWQQAALADNAREVFDLGKDLYSRLGTFAGHMEDLGKRIGGSVEFYNKALGSFEGNFLVAARRFRDLEFVDSDIPEIAPLEKTPRTFVKPELVEAIEDAHTVRAISPSSPAAIEPDRLGDYGIDAGATPTRDWRTGS